MRVLFLALFVLSGCASNAPLRTALPPLESRVPPRVEAPLPEPLSVEVTLPTPPPPPRPVYLYTRTDEDLRVAFADGLALLLNRATTPAQPRRASPDEARAWLGFLRQADPTASAAVLEHLGPVLNEQALVAYVLPGSNPASCARLRETLFIGIPERHQTASRPYAGFIAQDGCSESACLRCVTVSGQSVDGRRPRVCTLGPCGR